MRLALRVLAMLGAVGAVEACIDHPEAPAVPAGSETFPPASNNPQPSGTGTATTPTPKPDPPKPKDAKSVLTEVVYVLMNDYDGGHWMCTGALVSNDTVVTAAHCLNENQFESYEIVAPLLADKPRVSASRPGLLSYDYEDISQPDIGFLKLDEPIDVPQYAQLTDITERVEKGEKLTAVAIVRQEEDFEAPFKAVEGLNVKSSTATGYDRGFTTQYFSHGGDSGAGLFLVESGQVTHKLIAVARQPEPDKKLDHFTRVDGDFLDWFNENAGGGN